MSGFYSIPLAGLREGRYTYDFKIGDDFFEEFESSEIHHGNLIADVVLEKRSSHMELTVTINGVAEVVCDRCLELFNHSVSCTNKLFVKLGSGWNEDDPEMITIPADEHEIDLSQFFYEYIHLALPIKRVHPDDRNGNSTCNPEMIRKLSDHLVSGDEKRDPRWDDLKKIAENN